MKIIYNNVNENKYAQCRRRAFIQTNFTHTFHIIYIFLHYYSFQTQNIVIKLIEK